MADADIGENEEIELQELEEAEDEEEIGGTEETNLDDLEWDSTELSKASRASSSSNPSAVTPDLGPPPSKPSGLKRIFTRDRKIFLKNGLNVSLNKGDGPNSTTLFDNLQLTNDQRSRKNNGARFKGVKIIVVKDGRYEYSTNSNKETQAIAEFKATLEKAKVEHAKTAIGETEKQFAEADVTDISEEDVISVLDNIEDQLSKIFEELESEVLEVRKGGLTHTEVDELIGVVAFDRTGNMSPTDQIKTLTEVEIPFWKEKLKGAQKDSVRSKHISGVVEMMEVKSDILRIRNNQKPETDLVKKLIWEEATSGDISRFKKFSKWARENLFGLSAVVISAAGILTTILIAGRGAVRSGARAMGSFGRALAKVAKKLAPVFGAVLNLIGSMLSLGAKGINWLANNLWSLALLLGYVAYNEISKNTK